MPNTHFQLDYFGGSGIKVTPEIQGENAKISLETYITDLKNGDKVLIFPEGTRIQKGKISEPHSGAVMIAARMKVPIVPVYLSTKKHFWQPVKLIYGTPYSPEYAGTKPTQEELESHTAELMQKIYAMGEQA